VFDRCESLGTERRKNVEDTCERTLGAGIVYALGHCGYEDGIGSAALDDKHVWRVGRAARWGAERGSGVAVVGGGVLYGDVSSA